MTAGTISSAAFGDTTSCFTIMATARSPMSLATPASTTNKSDGEPDVPGSTTTATATLIFSSAITSSSIRSEEHTSELQSRLHLVCRLLLEKKKKQPHTLRNIMYHLQTDAYIMPYYLSHLSYLASTIFLPNTLSAPTVILWLSYTQTTVSIH